MKTVARRIAKLEDALARADKPRRRLRIAILMGIARPSLEDATCTRMLCSDGTLMETMMFNKRNVGPDELTNEQVDRWIESFPVQVLPR